MPKFPAIIFSVDWVIVAVGKEILIPVGFVGGSPKDIRGICIDKPSPDRVIVPAVQVVQARFGVIDIPAIAQGVRGAEGGGHGAVGFQVEIPVAVVHHGRRSNGVVGKVQLVAAPCHLRQPGYLFLLVGFLILQVGRYFPAPQAFKLHAFLARQ